MDDAGLRWYHAYFGQLVGATITDFIFAKDEEMGEYWPTFKVKLADGREVEIELSQDEEGNGPGWIFGLDKPAP
jgi:hypothetical protein